MMTRQQVSMSMAVLAILSGTFTLAHAGALWQVAPGSAKHTQLNYQLAPNFLKLPSNLYLSEVSGVALNSRGHIFVFQRGAHPLGEFDTKGNFVRTMGESLFTRPHGLRIDASDDLWVTDNGAVVRQN